MIAVKTLDVTQDFKSIADRIMQGEKILISRPKNENIVMITETEYNELEKIRKENVRKNFGEAFKAAQEEALRNGTSEMTMDEINDIIAEVRKEHRREIKNV